MAAPLTMYDPATGAPVQVDAAQAGALFREGKATFAADQDVPVMGADGKVRIIKGADAGAFFSSSEGLATGAASGQQLREQQLQDEFGGVGGTLGAALTGAARGATLGLSDLALTETGLVDARTLAGQQEANPFASLAGEGLGILGAVAASGGAAGAGRGVVSGAARAVTAPTRAVMALGRGVEGAGAAILGEGVVARAATAAAQGAVEGSLFGVGQAVSESSIKDVPLTAERLMAAMGHGALLGGGLGAGASALGSLVRGGVAKIGEVGSQMLGRETQLAQELAGSVVPQGEGTIAALVDRYGREQAIKSAGGTQAMVERLQGMGQNIEQRVIKKLLDEAPEILGKRPGGLLNAAEKAAAAEKILERDGQRIGTMLDELAAAGQKPNVTALVGEFRQRVAAETAAAVSPDAQRAARQMDDWLTSVEQKVGAEGADVRTLWEARRELRKDIDWKKPVEAGDRYNNWKRDLYRSMGDEIEATGARAGADGALGPDFAARWKNGNADYRAAAWLNEATARGAARETSNRMVGLSEQLGMLGGLAQGGVAGLPLALGGAVVQHLVKRYGSDVAARVARAATHAEGVVALDRAVQDIAGERVASLLGAAREAPRAASGLAATVSKAVRAEMPADPLPQGGPKLSARFKEKREELTSSMATRDARLAAATDGLDGLAPGLAEAVRGRVVAASDYLASQLPQARQRPSLQPHLERERLPSDSEMARYLRIERAINDPLSVLEDARKAPPRKEVVEAVRAIYPTMYQALGALAVEQAQSKEERLSYGQRVNLQRLFPELPIEPSATPQAIRFWQSAQQQAPSPFVPATGGAPGSPPSPPRLPLKPPQLALKSDQIGA